MRVYKLLEEIKEILVKQNLTYKESLSFNEAVVYLDVSKSFLYKLTSQGKITHYKPNKKLLYFKKKDLDDFLQRNQFKGQFTNLTWSNQWIVIY